MLRAGCTAVHVRMEQGSEVMGELFTSVVRERRVREPLCWPGNLGLLHVIWDPLGYKPFALEQPG